MASRYDVVVVGGGHNGLVTAAMLARAGLSVLVLERAPVVGGAAISGRPFAGVDARLSRFSYLVSLFPASLRRELGLNVELVPRQVESYTPAGADRGLLLRGDGDVSPEWARLRAMLVRVAVRVFPTLTEPLRSREEMQALVADDDAWSALFEQPLSNLLERTLQSDVERGVVLTDATIGTFAPAGDRALRQNRCFLYHVIGNGTGRWDVPRGGMGAVTSTLSDLAVDAGAEIRARAEVASIETDGRVASVACGDGFECEARNVVAGVAPVVLARLLRSPEDDGAPEGAQLKINMLLRRLPALRDRVVSPEDAFAGTFHVNEGYEQLQRAYEQALSGQIPELPPCELYCHSLTDPTILSDELRAAGAQTLTLFGLHMPARLFAGGDADAARAKADAVEATLRSLNSVLAEPIEDCLWVDAEGRPCLEAVTPCDLEAELGMPGGHIFHRDLAWPFAESEEDVGRWGVETEWPNVWLCGAGARRGGGVSGIPGHNAARAVLTAVRERG